MIFFTSDTHFFHNKEFLFGDRGFETTEDMVAEIVKRWNETVAPDDIVYHLGDVMLSDTDRGIEVLKRLNGHIHIIRGNHCTDERVKKYLECPNVIDVKWADMIKIHKIHFFLTHAPCIYRSMDDKPNKQGVINLHGHTHQETNFLFKDNPYVYHVGVDSHNLTPVSIDEILKDIEIKKDELMKGIIRDDDR